MIILPKVRGFICTTAHPDGCAKNVKHQIDYVKKNIVKPEKLKPTKVLVIGASTGYGLASRIVSSFGYGFPTIGVFWERNAIAEKTTSSAGWYNSAAFEREAGNSGLYAKSINGDAFSLEVKERTIELIKQDWQTVDLIIYSVAAPRRVINGAIYNSVLKPVGEAYKNKTVDINTGKVSEIEILPATQEELEATIKVMGGEDLRLWVDLLHSNNLLANDCKIIAYSYIGPEITYPVYRNGTIGLAKEHLEKTVKQLDEFLITNYHGRAFVSVNKALVTQASAAIPVVPLYISLLYKVMKSRNIHEGCIEQITRLFNKYLYYSNNGANCLLLDNLGRIRIDELEMREDVQQEVLKLWEIVNTENLATISDLFGYKEEFYKLFGFNFTDVNYEQDYSINVPIPSVIEYV